MCSTSSQLGDTFWGKVSATVEQSRPKANTIALGDGKFGLDAGPRIP